MKRLAAIAVSRSNFASCAAVARATRSASPSAVTWLTSPTACAFVALMLRPVSSRSRTTALPRSRLSRGMPPKPGIRPEPQLRKAEARHFVGDDQIAGERQFEAAAKRDAVDGRNGGQRRGVDRVHHAMNALEKIAHAGQALARQAAPASRR